MGQDRAGRKRFALRWVLWLAVLAVIAGGFWLSRWFGGTPIEERERSGILLHLTSRLGQQAPPFTLTDSEGVAHSVAPGGGTPTVIIFHMGTQ
jgi:hypothetical protein